MKHSLRKKINKSNKFRKNRTRKNITRKTRTRKNRTRKTYSGAGFMETYNSASQNAQTLYAMYLNARNQYNTLMNQYNEIEAQYLQMKQILEKIKNDPEVQQQLIVLSNLNSQLQQSIQKTSPPTSPPLETQEVVQNGGFLKAIGVQSANQYYTTGQQKAKASYSTAKNVYNNPEVQQNLQGLKTHSYNTAKHGAMFGINVATGAPISAAYRGYNTYKSAKKGINSAQNLYKSANDVYQASSTQPI